MRWGAIALVFGLIVGGCGPDRGAQEAACQLDAEKFVQSHSKEDDPLLRFYDEGGKTELCMRAHGYTRVNSACPVLEQFSKDDPPTLNTGTRVATQQTDARC
jgi:hypothetical protein